MGVRVELSGIEWKWSRGPSTVVVVVEAKMQVKFCPWAEWRPLVNHFEIRPSLFSARRTRCPDDNKHGVSTTTFPSF